ncbi:hypothetical protein [Cellulosilyticum sp. I15G10I2]|uniref:hypothetical protein n=1 Tax=Cellulosilyticum sp. I15G10I2 TaxID=1892843 RepID=UPI00085BFB3E|nr:hypothetical protein [Cellulosilyticum sp. I15G10I2]
MSMKHLKYCPELNQITGSINATILLLQLEYWFAKMTGGKFYKFLDSCEHELYKQGDSWVEELGFSKQEFRTAFSKIGKVYTSKKAFKESKDLFNGKYYASYYDRIKGLTYYIRNDAKLSELFDDDSNKILYSEEKSTENTEDVLRTPQIIIPANPKTSSPLSVEYNKLLTSVKDTHPTKVCVPYETIKALFNQYCPSYPQLTLLTAKRKTLLKKLWYDMGQTLENFKQAFLSAENSDFLSGRLGSWRASFDWLIQEDKFVALLEGCYTNNRRQSQFSPSTPSAPKPHSKFTTMYSHYWDFEELEKLEDQYIDRQIAKYSTMSVALD